MTSGQSPGKVDSTGLENIWQTFKKIKQKKRRDYLQSLVLEKYSDLLRTNDVGAEPAALLDSALQHVAEQNLNPFTLEEKQMTAEEESAHFRDVVSREVASRQAEIMANNPAWPEDVARIAAKEKFLKDVLAVIPEPPPIDPKEIEGEFLPEIQR